MEIDAKLLKKLAELKKQLEGISGQKIDASPEQLISLFFRVSLSSSKMASSCRGASSSPARAALRQARFQQTFSMSAVVRQPAPTGRRFSYLAISFAAPSIFSQNR